MTRTFVWAKFRKGRESRKRSQHLRLSLYVPNGTTEGSNDPVPRLWGEPSEFRPTAYDAYSRAKS